MASRTTPTPASICTTTNLYDYKSESTLDLTHGGVLHLCTMATCWGRAAVAPAPQSSPTTDTGTEPFRWPLELVHLAAVDVHATCATSCRHPCINQEQKRKMLLHQLMNRECPQWVRLPKELGGALSCISNDQQKSVEKLMCAGSLRAMIYGACFLWPTFEPTRAASIYSECVSARCWRHWC